MRTTLDTVTIPSMAVDKNVAKGTFRYVRGTFGTLSPRLAEVFSVHFLAIFFSHVLHTCPIWPVSFLFCLLASVYSKKICHSLPLYNSLWNQSKEFYLSLCFKKILILSTLELQMHIGNWLNWNIFFLFLFFSVVHTHLLQELMTWQCQLSESRKNIFPKCNISSWFISFLYCLNSHILGNKTVGVVAQCALPIACNWENHK